MAPINPNTKLMPMSFQTVAIDGTKMRGQNRAMKYIDETRWRGLSRRFRKSMVNHWTRDREVDMKASVAATDSDLAMGSRSTPGAKIRASMNLSSLSSSADA